MKKMELENTLLEIPATEIKLNGILFTKTFSELNEALKHIKKEFLLKYFNLNRDIINELLYHEDTNIKLVKENINIDDFQSIFNLYYIINNDIDTINYTYEFDIIKELHEKIEKEKNSLRKFIFYIFLYAIFYNFEGFKESLSSSEEKLIKTFKEEIKAFMSEQQPLVNEFNLNLDLNYFEVFNIDTIYSIIIMSLIRNKKFDDYKYATNTLELMDLENIELTHNMYEQLKNEFDNNSDKEYINCYKINNYEDLINSIKINFYYILFKYVFKDPIYIYNIQFLLEARKAIVEISKKYLIEILKSIQNEENKEKFNFILKQFLDVQYNFIIEKILIKLSTNIENFLTENKSEDVEEVEKLMNVAHISSNDLLSYNKELKKYKVRCEILKFIYNKNKEKISKSSKEFKVLINSWEVLEKRIHEKRINKIHYKKELLSYFKDQNNRNSLLEIFTEEEINYFIKKSEDNQNLAEIKNYYINYLFETKKKDISKINRYLLNNEEFNLAESRRYLKDLNTAKEMNSKYVLIKYLFKLNDKTISEKEINSSVEQLKIIEKDLEEKNFDNVDEIIKIELLKYFEYKQNQKECIYLLKENPYKYLIEQKKNIVEEILYYYKDFFPDSKKKEIESIENGNIEEQIWDEYSKAKNMNLRKNIIFTFIESNMDKNELEIKKAIEKWNKIEEAINNKQYQSIDKVDKLVIINNYSKGPAYEFITKIFNKEIFDSFIAEVSKENEENINDVSSFSTTTISSTPIKTGKKKKKIVRKRLNEKKLKNDTQSLNLNSSMKNSQEKFDTSSIGSNESSTKLTSINKKTIMEEDKKEKDEGNLSNFYLNNILSNGLKIIYIPKNKMKIQLINENTCISQCHFKLCQEYCPDKKSSKAYKLFKFLSDFIETLQKELKNNDSFVIDLKIKEKEDNQLVCIYKYCNNENSNNLIEFKDINFLGEGIKNLIKEIKARMPKREDEKTLITDENSSKIESNCKTIPENMKKKIGDDAFIKWDPDKYKILEFVKVLVNNKENDKKNFTAEFIREQGDNTKYFIGGVSNFIKILEHPFKGDSKNKEIESSEVIYNICNISDSKKDTTLLICTNKEIIEYKELNKDNKIDNSSGLNKYTLDNNADNMKIRNALIVMVQKKEGEKEMNCIYAGTNGVVCYTKSAKSKTNYTFQLVGNNAYRGLININNNLIAMTSNKFIINGDNKLVIYNLCENKIEKEIKNDKDESKYSFIPTSNGMTVINMKDTGEKYLLCACKKYFKGQKNGILLINIFQNFSEKFFDTEEFEVYCFCQIVDKNQNNKEEEDINNPNDNLIGTDFFLVGGFDEIIGEGKIKLFKLVKEKDNENITIKFLQDIVFDEMAFDKNEPPIIKWVSKGAQSTKEPSVTNETTIEEDGIDIIEYKERNYTYFKGAISCIIQNKYTFNIMASCYDGKIYLFTKPNLSLYGQKLSYIKNDKNDKNCYYFFPDSK